MMLAVAALHTVARRPNAQEASIDVTLANLDMMLDARVVTLHAKEGASYGHLATTAITSEMDAQAIGIRSNRSTTDLAATVTPLAVGLTLSATHGITWIVAATSKVPPNDSIATELQKQDSRTNYEV